VRHCPDRGFDPRLADAFNREIQVMFDDSRDFVQAHYLASPRNDTEFWRANGNGLRISDQLQQKLADYDAGLPVNMPKTDEESYYRNFEAEFDNYWTNGSYYCILSGLGRRPSRPLPYLAHRPESLRRAAEKFAGIRTQAADLRARLPSNYEFLTQLHGGQPGS
jgi:tryptophan halogenase